MARYEISFLPGLQNSVVAELQRIDMQAVILLREPDSLTIESTLTVQALNRLRCASALYLDVYFPVARPRALLGHENLQKLLAAVDQIKSLTPFKSFRFSAAGKHSAVMTRLHSEIAQHAALPYDEKNGELLIRLIRRSDGWSALLRTTRRPLSARRWRVANMPGALNACIAAALIQDCAPLQGTYCNVTCGSGSLLIEAALQAPELRLIGLDSSIAALRLSQKNLVASQRSAALLCADARRIPLPAESIDILISDLPWGERIGDRSANQALYTDILAEAERLLTPNGRAIFLTQHSAAFEFALRQTRHLHAVSKNKIFQKGFRPTSFKLHKK